ncbi:MAG: ABC transporter ATP-binding protein [Thermoanaerobacteraceae bacterium]|nr:ABC transporter ATP-binding protein [Thermoanaerobacteraceae bacterium]
MGRNIVIETHDLIRIYGSITAVDKLNLTIYEGEIFGLLGPNGAGKTTTILMLMGLTEPTSGSISVMGYDPTREPLQVKRVAGYMPDSIGFYDYMTGRENLLYTASLNQIPMKEAERRADELLSRVGLKEASDCKVRGYSRGMRQRLGVADVLIKDPKILILDEPTLGIDPEGVKELLELIVKLSKEEGKTILISSHLLYQMQEICDRVGIFVKGKLMVCGKITDLAENISGEKECAVELIMKPFDVAAMEIIRSIDGVKDVYTQGAMLVADVQSDEIAVKINRELIERGYIIYHFRVRGYTLDDIYRQYFGEEGVTI